MLHTHHASGFCPKCHEGRFVLDESLKTPWHRRLKAGVDPRGEHVTTDYEVFDGVGQKAANIQKGESK